jgi:hypothetical protein
LNSNFSNKVIEELCQYDIMGESSFEIMMTHIDYFRYNNGDVYVDKVSTKKLAELHDILKDTIKKKSITYNTNADIDIKINFFIQNFGLISIFTGGKIIFDNNEFYFLQTVKPDSVRTGAPSSNPIHTYHKYIELDKHIKKLLSLEKDLTELKNQKIKIENILSDDMYINIDDKYILQYIFYTNSLKMNYAVNEQTKITFNKNNKSCDLNTFTETIQILFNLLETSNEVDYYYYYTQSTNQMERIRKGECTATKMILMHLVTGQEQKTNMVLETLKLADDLWNNTQLDLSA